MKGLLIQEFKTLFKSPAALSILIIPVVLMIGLGYLLPSGWIVPSAITIGIVGSVLLYFGGSLEEIKRTSFMKSISLTKLNKFTFLSTKILFSVFVSLFSVIWVLFFAWIFTGPIPFLAINFSHILPPSNVNITDLGSALAAITGNLTNDAGEVIPGQITDVVAFVPFAIDWSRIDWILMLYAGASTIVVSIAIAFIFVTFSKSSLSFYLMSFGYLLGMILFGGVVMPSFLISKDNDWFKSLYYIVPNFYTNNVMAQAFGGSLGGTINNISDSAEQIIDNGLIPIPEVVKNATDSELKLVNDFMTGWQKKWSMADLDAWYNGLATTDKTDYINLVYQVLSLPKHLFGGLDSWKDVFVEIGGVALGTTWTTGVVIQPILIKLIGNTDNGIEALFNTVNGLITGLASGPVKSLTDTLRSMFNTAGTIDYIVPWVETIVFLLIATRYFKWS